MVVISLYIYTRIGYQSNLLFINMFRKKHYLICLVFLSGCMEPVTHLEEKRIAEASKELAYFHRGIEPESTLYLSLAEAIDMAMDRNLELNVNRQQVDIQYETFARQTLTMLPNLTAHALWSYRTENTGASSKSLVPNIPPAPPSVSSEQTVNVWDITCTFKLIEFCIAYFKSTQEYNKTVALHFEYTRNAQNIVMKVVQAYWKLAAEIKNEEKGDCLLQFGASVRSRVSTLVKAGMINPENGARILAQLSIYQVQIEDKRKDYHRILAEFKQIIGAPPDIEIVLTDAIPIKETILLPSLKELEEEALTNRPDLYTKDVQEVIVSDELHIALIQIFPEVAPFWSSNYDANRFLIFNNWTTVGINTAWYLLTIPLRLQEGTIAHKQKRLNHYNRLQLALAVLTQVHLSYALLYDDVERMRILHDLWVERNKLLQIAKARKRMMALGDVEYFNLYFEAYQSEADLRRSIAEVQGSIEQLNNSIGRPLYYGHCEVNS